MGQIMSGSPNAIFSSSHNDRAAFRDSRDLLGRVLVAANRYPRHDVAHPSQFVVMVAVWV
jgi:hypothetical protein